MTNIFDYDGLDRLDSTAADSGGREPVIPGAGGCEPVSVGGPKEVLGGSRPQKQQEAPQLTLCDSRKEQLLIEMLDSHNYGVPGAWLEQALNTHRFTSIPHFEECTYRELFVDTQRYIQRNIHPDKIPRVWDESPQHAEGAHAMYKYYMNALQENCKLPRATQI